MANSINSISTGTGGLQSIADGVSGNLLIQKDAGTIATFSATGVVVSGVVAATTLTGDGSALTGITSGGVTHLGTMTTTSGTSQTITGLDFTDLNLLIFVVAQVSHSDGTSRKLSIGVAGGANLAIGDAVAAGNCSIGLYTLDLRSNTGYFPQSPGNAPITSGSDFVGGGTGQARYLIGTNLRASSSTSVTVAFEGGVTFDNGKVEVYGLN